MLSRDVSSCDVRLAVGMWEAIFHWIIWPRFTLLSLCLRHVISRASTPLTFLLSHTFLEVSSRDVRMVCPRPKKRVHLSYMCRSFVTRVRVYQDNAHAQLCVLYIYGFIKIFLVTSYSSNDMQQNAKGQAGPPAFLTVRSLCLSPCYKSKAAGTIYV